jgi:hypothetical protein
MRTISYFLSFALAASTPALADETSAPSSTAETASLPALPFFKDWHVGLNVRADVGTHPIRVDGGLRTNGWDFILVLDPMFWTDGQTDSDLLVVKRSDRGWQGFLGWRLTTIGLADGVQLHEKLLLGLGGDLPHVSEYFRATFGFELAVLLVKHGGGIPAETISFKSSRSYIDLLNFGMFVRFEFTRDF